MNSPFLSIIIPIYNVEKYLKYCVDSVFRQGLREDEFEIILVNDGTKDNSMATVEDIILQHHNIVVINQSNQGLSVARNTGLKTAKGEYVLFVDSDDLLIDNTLQYMVNIAKKTHADTLKALILKKLERDTIIPSYIYEEDESNKSYKIMNGEEAFINVYNAGESYVYQNLYRKQFLIDNNLQFIPQKTFEDIPFYVESLLKAKNVAIVPIHFYLYRLREGSIMSSMNISKLLSMNDINQYIYNLQKSIQLSDKAKIKLEETIFFNMIRVNVWYITHYKSLYEQRDIFIIDLKKRLKVIRFNYSIKHKLLSLILKCVPSLYINIRYILASKKYGYNKS